VDNVATGVTWSEMSDLVKGFTYGNGLTFAATYDLDYRIATLKVKNGATDIVSQSFGYSDNVNLTSIADTLTAANNQTFTYTGLGRLQNATGVYGAYTFTTDPVGNRTQEVKTVSGTTTTKVLGYPATSNRLSSETTNGTLTRSFTYDGAGNTLTGLPVGAAYAFDYNKRNRPSALKQSGTTVTSYLYNALEQLSSRAVSSPLTPVGTTHYIYDLDGRLIAEAFGASASTAVIVREYIWLEGMPVMAIDGVNTATPVLMAVHTDHLTRPIRMTNASKTQVWNAQWLPHGAAHAITGTATQNLRFPGQYFLIEQGLAYNWHRFYDATTGRYIQPDPLGFVDGPSRYAYALNSPLINTDEDGLRHNPASRGIDDALRGLGIPVPAWTPQSCPAGPGIFPFPPLEMSRRGWTCSASCNVQEIVPGSACPARVFGAGSGSSQRDACTAAKRAAGQSTPRGCYPRHCQCRCSQG
jgi:RHS repeat-associated protein